jgi:hypothetical protein
MNPKERLGILHSISARTNERERVAGKCPPSKPPINKP